MTACVNKRSLVWLTGLATLVALIVPVIAATPALGRGQGSHGPSLALAAVPPGTTLDCDDGNGSGAAATDDREVNVGGDPETYTCSVTDGVDPVGNITIDAEHQGSTDPDNKPFGSTTNLTTDYDNACTTTAGGTCTFELPRGPVGGAAFVCFWVDDDTDAQYQQSADIFDGGDCDNGEATDEAEDNDLTDKVAMTWVALLNAAPETATKAAGTSHTVTATVHDDNGDPAENELVDFEVEGPRNNLAIECDDVSTDSVGMVSCTYDDTASPQTAGNDRIRVYVNGQEDAGEGRTATDADATDLVEVSWTAVTACSDGVDNDGDRRRDLGDPGCASAADNNESDACDINGTPGRNVLVGTGAGEVICGRGGNDTIRGAGGRDTIRGDLGSDRLLGGLGNDRLKGGDGRDTLKGGAGNDFLDGGNARDRCRGGSGRNTKRRCE